MPCYLNSPILGPFYNILAHWKVRLQILSIVKVLKMLDIENIAIVELTDIPVFVWK